jgi:serine/threonine protein kinase
MADRSGQRLDKYQLIRLLGQGAFGQVYLGENVFRKTQVAVKVLQTQLTSEELHAFLNEARIFSLEHPNIVRVKDFGVERTTSTPFIVMDYAPNGTLRQRHPRGTQLPLATVVSYVKQVAAALQYAHEENLIHRDVKPENMLVGQNGEIVLSDFGIAVISQSGRTSLENPQNLGMGGTPYYMAPEQFLGKPGRSSDQYALGIVVYEWLCGERPFNGTLFELLGQHMHAPPPPLRGKVPGISLEVEQVVLRALEKEPQKRFASVQEFAAALEEAYKKELALRQIPMIEGKTKEQWLKEGNAHYHAKRYREAIVAYDRAIALDPKYAIASTYRGTAYLELKEYQKAIADYERAIALDPNDAAAYNNRDLVYYDLKEYQGRADDVIISAGYRIGPFEVERALKEHPAVAESAVVASPDEMRGEVVKAFVILAPGHTPSPELATELQEHVKRVTAPYKYPREIEFVDSLPKTISRKIRRVELREMERKKKLEK